jgi:SAM-dependent methyltransferase
LSEVKKITEANRIVWNEAVPIHKKSRKIDYLQAFLDPNFSVLDEIETAKLIDIGLHEKSVAQLCCNNGRELLSILRLGAKSGIGFDICDKAIEEAEQLVKATKQNCRFIRLDVYEISEEFTSLFDLIYISVGALNWLPDLEGFFRIVARLLRKKGHLLIYDVHPATNMLAVIGESEFNISNPYKIVNSYFEMGTKISTDGIDYIGKSVYDSAPGYEFNYKLSDLFKFLIDSGILIIEFAEYPHDISCLFGNIEDDNFFPLSYILSGQKR